MTSISDGARGFTLIRFLDLLDRKPFELPDDFSTIPCERCPCDRGEIRMLGMLIGQEGNQKIGIASCPSCGWIGYRDRPSPEWLRGFYASHWQKMEPEALHAAVARLKEQYGTGAGQTSEYARLAQKLVVDRSRFICDIGCGHGVLLNEMRDRGFHNLVGVENSRHRAQIAEEAFGLPVIAEPFESAAAQERLRRYAPLGIVTMRHVLEHSFDPDAMLALVSNLQEEGGYLVISVPHVAGEPAMGVLLFLPHLHSFSARGIARLLARHGYAIAEGTRIGKRNMTIVARKTNVPSAPSAGSEDLFADMKRKMICGLGLGREYRYSPRRLWWYRMFDVGGQRRMFGDGWLERMHEAAALRYNKYLFYNRIIAAIGTKRFAKRHRMNSALVGDLPAADRAAGEAPVIIRFPGRITMLCK